MSFPPFSLSNSFCYGDLVDAMVVNRMNQISCIHKLSLNIAISNRNDSAQNGSFKEVIIFEDVVGKLIQRANIHSFSASMPINEENLRYNS